MVPRLARKRHAKAAPSAYADREKIPAQSLAIAAWPCHIGDTGAVVAPGSGRLSMVKETETVTVAKAKPKKEVAEHTLIMADGTEAKSEEEATGTRYKLLENGKSFERQYADAPDHERRMLYNFACKTLATNETSAIRNRGGTLGPGDADEQYEAMVSRFDAIRDGNWTPPDRTREGPRIDVDKLASAIVAVLIANGKRTEAEAESEHARQLGKIADADTGKAYVAGMRQNPEVAAKYAELSGKKVATLDDMAA